MPFSKEEFTDIFVQYNTQVFPVQIIFYIIAMVIVILLYKEDKRNSKIISFFLFFFWMWMGIVYHLFLFTSINSAAYLFGAAFILQSIFFFNDGVLNGEFLFSFKKDFYCITGAAFIIYAALVYQVLGIFLGHEYPGSPTFGLPCPTTIFTIGLLLMTDKRVPVHIIIIPFLWSLIGFKAAISMGIFEDAGLLIAGAAGTTMIIFKNNGIRRAGHKQFPHLKTG